MSLLLGIIASRGGGSGGSEALPTQLAAFTDFELEFTDGGYIVRWTNTSGGNGAKVYAGTSAAPTDLVATVTGTEYEGTATNGVPIYVRLINKGPGYIDSDYSADASVTPADVNVGLAAVGIEGDSTTANTYLDAGEKITDVLDATLPGASFDLPTINIGKSGEETKDFYNPASISLSSTNQVDNRFYHFYDVLKNFNYASSRNILIINLGINDGDTVETRQTIYTGLVQRAKADGYIVILCSPIFSQHTPTDPPATTGDQFEIDAWMAANQATIGYDYLVRLIQDEFIGQFLTANEDYWFSDTYPTGDGTHYGFLGVTHVGEDLYAPVLAQAEARQRVIPDTPTIAEDVDDRTIIVTSPEFDVDEYSHTKDERYNVTQAASLTLTLPDNFLYKIGQAGYQVRQGINRAVSEYAYNTIEFPAIQPGGLTPDVKDLTDVTIPAEWHSGSASQGVAGDWRRPDSASYGANPASITFTEGIKFVNKTTVAMGAEFFVKKGSGATVRLAGILSNTQDEVMFEYYPTDADTYTLYIRGFDTGLAYIADGSITTYA